MDSSLMNYTLADLIAIKDKYEKDKARMKQLQHEWYEAHKDDHKKKVRAAEKVRRARQREERDAAKASQIQATTQVISV